MRLLLVGILTIILSGCLGEKTFDASSEASIKKSTSAIKESLPQESIEDFNKAVMYFSVGGENGFKAMMGAAFLGKADTLKDNFTVNLKVIDGLTGVQIIEKHKNLVHASKAIGDLEREAEELLKNKKFQKALEKYKEIGNIPSGVESSETGIKNTKKAMEDFTEKMHYLDKVEITDFIAKRIDTYLKEGIPSIRISLKNKGDRSLDMVKVTVYFQDKNGQTIFEEHFSPVLVSDYSFSGNNKPLKPGYVYEMEKDKFFTIKSELSEWSEGKAKAKIVDIKFSE